MPSIKIFGFLIIPFINDKVIIEVKATEQEQVVHRAQVLTYLRLTGLKLGLLLNSAHEAQLLSYLKLSDCRIGLLINFQAVDGDETQILSFLQYTHGNSCLRCFNLKKILNRLLDFC